MDAIGYLMVAAVAVAVVVVALVVAAQRQRDADEQPGRTADCPIPRGVECPFYEPSLMGSCRRCREERRARVRR